MSFESTISDNNLQLNLRYTVTVIVSTFAELKHPYRRNYFEACSKEMA